MRLMMVLAMAMLAACASAPRGGAGLEGTYRLDRVNGQSLPARGGSESNVVLRQGTLALQAGGRYALQMVADIEGQASDTTAEDAGTYRAFGDSLALVSDAVAETDAEEVRFRFSLDGPVLRLHDDAGDEYAFVREPGGSR